MKKVINKSVHLLIIALVHLLINSSIFAQAPQKMSYQAVIRNSNDSLLVSTPVGMRISLVQSSPTGTVVFSETQTATTNANGLVSLQIGMGTVVSGTFAGIDWAAGPYYVKTETDLSGGTNYTITSSNELLSVPYALFSANGTPGPSAYQVAVENGFIGTEAQWLLSLQGLTGPAGTFPPGTVAGEMNYWNGTAWVTVAPGSNNQNLTFCNGVPTWGPCPPAIPTVITAVVSSITNTLASSGGMVTSDNGAFVTARGVCWSTSSNPTVANNTTNNGSGTGSFTSNLNGLTDNTTYYLRAYATAYWVLSTIYDSLGNAITTNSTEEVTYYGNEVSFTTTNTTTNVVLPTVTTTVVSAITGFSASSGATITSEGNAPVTAWGICWSTSTNPTIANNFVQNNGGLSGLTPNTTYYVRSYATNSAGTAYGNELSFTTSTIVVPTITTTDVSEITCAFARSGATIISEGGGIVSEWGVCWSTSANPTIANNFIQYNGELIGLTPNTTYYVRAYATNSVGTAYGNELSFTTQNGLCIGQSYQGGIIAYISPSGTYGLIAAPSDQSTGAPWGCGGWDGGTLISGADGTSIGTGAQNTIDIMNGCSTAGIAARLCGDLELGGYSDWYLPSRDELYQLYINRVAIGGFGIGNGGQYWSSTEANANEAYRGEFFYDWYGGETREKNFIQRVRAIRAF